MSDKWEELSLTSSQWEDVMPIKAGEMLLTTGDKLKTPQQIAFDMFGYIPNGTPATWEELDKLLRNNGHRKSEHGWYTSTEKAIVKAECHTNERNNTLMEFRHSEED